LPAPTMRTSTSTRSAPATPHSCCAPSPPVRRRTAPRNPACCFRLELPHACGTAGGARQCRAHRSTACVARHCVSGTHGMLRGYLPYGAGGQSIMRPCAPHGFGADVPRSIGQRIAPRRALAECGGCLTEQYFSTHGVPTAYSRRSFAPRRAVLNLLSAVLVGLSGRVLAGTRGYSTVLGSGGVPNLGGV
jgi:hypothetical protein